ncbi:hypothetical protein H6F44_10985 [Pseudanabaena sp. FACHB-1277]|uniref:CRISPR type III-associated protein domain-containing protein n=2 Tax=Pseudanabaena TaxID=1152 RepID=A0A926UV95_9CYAN|nr:hypothetical protein [Pseudanabaena cinerea FACHB-1277]
MMSKLSHRKDHRYVIKRIIVKGILILDTPTCLGVGDTDSPVDLPILRDSIEDKALLTGSSIAGALRNYLREYNRGYNDYDRRTDLAALLFGDLFVYKDERDLTEKEKVRIKHDDTQSPLIINDALSDQVIKAELRDGVSINGKTRTAKDDFKYDLEFLQAGTEFSLFFELLIEEGKDETQLKQGLAIALSGFEKGEIAIGMKKRRGFGRCKVDNWQVWEFDLKNTQQRLAWLTFDRDWASEYAIPSDDKKILGDTGDDQRDRFTITATFSLVGSMLIRSAEYSKDKRPDAVHLKSHRPNKEKPQEYISFPIISGTSLAGVLRHRAVRIINTLEKDLKIVEDIFGTDISGNGNKDAKASKLIVHESEIKNNTELVQTRIAIDRFTGGAMHGALFDAQPIFSGEVELKLELRNPQDYEIGLLLLLLKDLWTEDLPIGGESSIGRGRLKGKEAILNSQSSTIQQEWKIENGTENSLIVKDLKDENKTAVEVQAHLQKFVIKLTNHIHHQE